MLELRINGGSYDVDAPVGRPLAHVLREDLDQIKELLLAARELWRAMPEVQDDRDRIAVTRSTFRLIHLADILAVTTSA